jgi:release factor glutamine methyltransferase
MTRPDAAQPHPDAAGSGWVTVGATTVWVEPGVFPPHPDTLAVIEWCTVLVGRLRRPTVVDLCTGCGIIAIALATAQPAARIVAVDSSPVAVRAARAGVERLGRTLAVDVRVREGDATDPGVVADLRATADLVVANPPYLRDGTAVPPELAAAAGPAALFGGADGLEVIRGVLAVASATLRAGGWLAVEHAAGQQHDVVGLIDRSGDFHSVTGHDDAGTPRFVTARRGRPGGRPDIASA